MTDFWKGFKVTLVGFALLSIGVYMIVTAPRLSCVQVHEVQK